MKFRISISLLLTFILFLSYNSIFSQEETIRVMTYNIRFANENPGEEWSVRKLLVNEMIKFHNPDIFGVQEALKSQIDYLDENFSDFYWVGVGRDDGAKEGEYSAIFISKKFNLIDSGTFWLSQTPANPSIGWDAAFKRIVTWAKLFDQVSKDTILVFNTHFDHIGKNARLNSAKLILEKTQPFIHKFPVILMGDFNDTDTSDVYSVLTENNLFQDAQFKDNTVNYGSNITFNGFGNNFTEGKIDFIFVNEKIRVLRHGIIGDKIDNLYASDHMPVITDITIK